MSEPPAPPASDETIKVVCRVRPLNSAEEKAGSKFILKFPSDDSIACSVSKIELQLQRLNHIFHFPNFIVNYHFDRQCLSA